MSEVAPIEYNIKGQRVRSTGDPLKDFQAIQKLFPEVNAGKLAPLIRAQFPSAPYSDDAYKYISQSPEDILENRKKIYTDLPNSFSRIRTDDSPNYEANMDEAVKRFNNLKILNNPLGAGALGMANTLSYGAVPYLSAPFDVLFAERPIPGDSFFEKMKNDIAINKIVNAGVAYENPLSTTAGSLGGLIRGPIGTKSLSSGIEASGLAANSPKLAAALTRTGEGALQGLGSTMAVNPNASSGEAAIGTASGAALNNVFGLFGDLLNKVAGKLGEKGWNSLLGQTPKQILKEQEKTGSSLGEKLYKRGVWGVSENSLMNQAKKGLESNEDILQTLLKEKSVAKEIVPEIPKGSVYVSEPSKATLDDLLELALSNNKTSIIEKPVSSTNKITREFIPQEKVLTVGPNDLASKILETPQLHKNSVYVSPSTEATLDDLFELAMTRKGSRVDPLTGFPERVIITKPAGTNPNVMRPDPIIKRTSSAPMGLDVPENILNSSSKIREFIPEKISSINQKTLENLPNKEFIPQFPSGATYIDSPTMASLDDMLELALSGTKPKSFEKIIESKKTFPEVGNREFFPSKPNIISDLNLAPNIIQTGKIDKSFMLKELTKLKDNFKGVVGRDSDLAKIEDTIQQIKNSADLSPIEANEIKRNIYKLRESSYNKDINPLQTMIEKAQAKGLKEGIEDVIPEAKGINQELSVFGKLKDALDLLSAKGKTDTISKSTTATGLIADMLFNSPLVNTAGPQVIKGVGGITQQSNKLASPVLMQLIDNLLNPPQQKRQGAYQ